MHAQTHIGSPWMTTDQMLNFELLLPGFKIEITFDREELPAGKGRELYACTMAHIKRGMTQRLASPNRAAAC